MALDYTELINKVMLGLRLRDRQSSIDYSSYSPLESGFSKPFITIAREPGSGGHPIGKLVADSLNFEFIDDEILEEIAHSTKKRKEVLTDVDEKGRTAIQDIVQGLINPDYVSDVTYVSELTRVILSYAYRGNVVILGRGANFITPFAQGLHVRLTAPYGVRVQRAVDYEGLNLTQAREVINKVEKDRKDFVKQYLKKSVDDADSYDLTLNTTYFIPEQSADLILQAFKSKFAVTKPFSKMLKK